MKKLLLSLLFLPSLLVSQDLPTVYATVDLDWGSRMYSGGEVFRNTEKRGYVPFNPFQRDPAFDTLDEGDKFIERGKILEKEYQDFLKDIDERYFELDEEDYNFMEISEECERIVDYYNKHGTITERMWIDFNCEYSCGDCDIYTNKASSTLDSDGENNYRVSNIIDRDPRTAWVEGESDYGIGEYFEILLNIYDLNIGILNGLQKSVRLWRLNSRVKTFKVYFNNVPICYLRLEDVMTMQYFYMKHASGGLDLQEKFYSITATKENMITCRFEIVDVYPGERWRDVCISEISNEPIVGCARY